MSQHSMWGLHWNHVPCCLSPCLLSPAACPPACCPLPAVPCMPVGWGHSQWALPGDAARPRGPSTCTPHFRWSLVFSVSVNFRLHFFGQSVLQSSALVLTEEETFPGRGDHAPLQLDCVRMKVQGHCFWVPANAFGSSSAHHEVPSSI